MQIKPHLQATPVIATTRTDGEKNECKVTNSKMGRGEKKVCFGNKSLELSAVKVSW